MSDVNPCITGDFWFKVLKKLPVKTLGKCRCVCKSWHSLIVSPSFMTAHHKNYTQNEANSLLLYRENVWRFPAAGRYEQYVFFADGDVTLEVSHTSVFPWTSRGGNHLENSLHFVGSVYGLVCLADDACISHTSHVWIWNPLLRKAINLPESAAATNVMSEVSSVLGFGYDGKNDHRLVRISSGRGKEGSEKATPFVEVYSVQEQTWRGISADYFVDNCIDHIPKVNSAHCFLDGIIHWLTWGDENRSHLGKGLLLFDVQDEKFGRMELPKALVEMETGDYGVFEYRSMLSVSRCQYLSLPFVDYTTCCCQIWVKEECNVGSSWCMVLSVILSDNVHVGPIDYLGRNADLLGFAKESAGELVAYDCKTGLAKGLGLRLRGSTKFSAYTESLVLLDYNTDISTQSTTQFELRRPISIIPRMDEAFVNFSNYAVFGPEDFAGLFDNEED